MEDWLSQLGPFGISAGLAALMLQILTVTQGLKRALESKWLVWILKMFGKEEIAGIGSVIVAGVVSVMTVVVQITADESLTGEELVLVYTTVVGLLGASGIFDWIKKLIAALRGEDE